MTRAEILTLTESLASDLSATVFDAPTYILRVNTAYRHMQMCVDEVDPELFMARATADIVANQARYERASYERVRRYEFKTSDDATLDDYAEIDPLIAEQALAVHAQRSRPVFQGYHWYHEGQEVVLVPTPTSSRTKGLRVVTRRVLALTADGDVPRLPEALHVFVAYGAVVYALEETRDGGEAAVDRLRRRWEALFPDQPTDQTRAALKRHFRRGQALSLGEA